MPRSSVRGFRPDRLRDLRVRAGLTHDDLAAKVGTSRQAVSTWEVGRSVPPPAALGRLARALDAPVSSLIQIPESQLRLADLRVLATMSQGEAAKRLGVSTTVLADIERGRKPMTDERVHGLAVLYDAVEEVVANAWRRTVAARQARADLK